MNFSEILLAVGISIISGIAGGVAVFWFFKGVHFFGGGLRLNNKDFFERYVWKYSFILAFLIIATFVISLIINLVSKTLGNFFSITYLLLFFGILDFVILTILLKWK